MFCHDFRMEQPLEPLELVAVVEDAASKRRSVRAVRPDHIRTEALDQRLPHLEILSQEPVHDLVAGDRRGAVTRKGCERFALTGADTAGDRDRRWATDAR
jgi:hypothetical protein